MLISEMVKRQSETDGNFCIDSKTNFQKLAFAADAEKILITEIEWDRQK